MEVRFIMAKLTKEQKAEIYVKRKWQTASSLRISI